MIFVFEIFSPPRTEKIRLSYWEQRSKVQTSVNLFLVLNITLSVPLLVQLRLVLMLRNKESLELILLPPNYILLLHQSLLDNFTKFMHCICILYKRAYLI